MYCIQTAEDIVKFLSRPGSPISLVFDPSADAQFQWEPSSTGRKIHGVGKNLQFRLKSPFISETTPDKAMVTVDAYRKS